MSIRRSSMGARSIAVLACCVALLAPQPRVSACGGAFDWPALNGYPQPKLADPWPDFTVEVRRMREPIAKLGESTDAFTFYDLAYDGREHERVKREQAEQERQPESLTRVYGRAFAEGELPEEMSLYDAAARAFAAFDDEQSTAGFRRVLALPSEQRPLRSTWATYSLGRALARSGKSEEAKRAFRETRELTRAGFSDPLELGIASLGEEARLEYEEDHWAKAIELYAQQIHHNPRGARASLRILISDFMKLDATRQNELLMQRPVQRLLTSRIIAREEYEPLAIPSEGELQRIAERLLALDVERIENADQLAMLSYQAGRYTQTARFLEKAGETGLAWWLRAELALREGSRSAAKVALARAAALLPPGESWNGQSYWIQRAVQWPHCDVEQKLAGLLVDEGRYVEALEHRACSDWLSPDAVFLAERVLDADEQRRFVDAHSTASDEKSWDMRDVLGRRLMREGKLAEALEYIHPVNVEQARRYVAATQRAERAQDPIERARALFETARIARFSGLEIMGYSGFPDFAANGGNGFIEPDAPDPRSTRDLRRLLRASEPPPKRFHYRHTASRLAHRSANLLPRRSQAFAAVLCHSTRWLIDLDPSEAHKSYRRYVKQGAVFDWTGRFGRACPEPDFDGLAKAKSGD